MTVVGTQGNPVVPTVLDLIMRAFRFIHVLGSGESLTTDESSDAFTLLNSIIEQANIDKLLGYQRTEVVFAFTPNQSSYTIGPASTTPNVVAPRPVEILSAFSRRQNVDLPIFVGHKQDYDSIQQKSVGIAGWQQMVYYEPSWPKGTLTFYMVPIDSLTEAHLTVMAEIPPFTSLNNGVSLPPVYTFWMVYKLGEHLSPEYGIEFTQKMQSILEQSEAALKRNNMKPLPIAATGLSGLFNASGGKFNVYSDTTR